MDTKTVVNTMYDGIVIAGLAMGYLMISSKFLKIDMGDPSRPNLIRLAKLGGATVQR